MAIKGSPKRVIVAGGAGFLGGHLCRRLVEAGHKVLSIDNYSTGRAENLTSLAGRPNFEARRHDVTAPLDAEADWIFNLACPASRLHYQRDPLQTMKTNVLGAITLLDLAERTGARILQASTSEVYGDPLTHPQAETYWGNVNPTGPRACYDEGKRAAETLFFDHRRLHGTEVKVVRIFNTFGPGMDPADGRVAPNFIRAALSGDPIALYGDGSQTRSFCYVDDLITGLIAMMESDAAVTGPINLGDPREISVRALAETVLRLTGSRSKLVFAPLPEDDPARRRPDISLAKAALGWAPETPFEEGLARTIAHFREAV